jgi:membrane-associated HD superfamily phosphohydrolase
MMADSVEAASRSLKEQTEEGIQELVNRIIDGQLADGLYKNAPITFRDIDTVKQVFIEKLKTMFHTRISYPELKNELKVNDKADV